MESTCKITQLEYTKEHIFSDVFRWFGIDELKYILEHNNENICYDIDTAFVWARNRNNKDMMIYLIEYGEQQKRRIDLTYTFALCVIKNYLYTVKYLIEHYNRINGNYLIYDNICNKQYFSYAILCDEEEHNDMVKYVTYLIKHNYNYLHNIYYDASNMNSCCYNKKNIIHKYNIKYTNVNRYSIIIVNGNFISSVIKKCNIHYFNYALIIEKNEI